MPTVRLASLITAPLPACHAPVTLRYSPTSVVRMPVELARLWTQMIESARERLLTLRTPALLPNSRSMDKLLPLLSALTVLQVTTVTPGLLKTRMVPASLAISVWLNQPLELQSLLMVWLLALSSLQLLNHPFPTDTSMLLMAISARWATTAPKELKPTWASHAKVVSTALMITLRPQMEGTPSMASTRSVMQVTTAAARLPSLLLPDLIMQATPSAKARL